jgi:hypothetical protein
LCDFQLVDFAVLEKNLSCRGDENCRIIKRIAIALDQSGYDMNGSTSCRLAELFRVLAGDRLRQAMGACVRPTEIQTFREDDDVASTIAGFGNHINGALEVDFWLSAINTQLA